MSDDSILFDLDADGVAVITINRPQVRNAVDKPTADALADALDRVDADDAVRVGILTGAGGGFCAGMDLKALTATGERPINERRGAFGIAAAPPAKPLIAAVEGHALGGGFEIALACDLIVAGESSTFGLPEVKRGLVAAAGGLLRLPRRVPKNIAMELALTGERIDAGRARELGLLSCVAADGGALDAARAIAASIAQNAPLAVRSSKEIIDTSPEWPMNEAFDRQLPLIQVIRESEDAAEGSRAFVEKRAPVWKGR